MDFLNEFDLYGEMYSIEEMVDMQELEEGVVKKTFVGEVSGKKGKYHKYRVESISFIWGGKRTTLPLESDYAQNDADELQIAGLKKNATNKNYTKLFEKAKAKIDNEGGKLRCFVIGNGTVSAGFKLEYELPNGKIKNKIVQLGYGYDVPKGIATALSKPKE